MSDLGTLIDRYLEDRWQRDPVVATSVGIHQYDHQLGDYSQEAVAEGHRRRQEFLAQFRALDAAPLPSPERLDWEMAVSELETALTLHSLRLWERQPAMYADLALTGVYLLTVRTFAPLRERLAAVRDRLRACRNLLGTAPANLTEATPPVFTESALQMAAGGVEFLRSAIPPLAEEVRGEDPQLAEEVLAANRDAQKVFEDYADFLQGYMERSRGSFAIGREIFDFLLHRDHFLSLDSDALYALGAQYFEATQAQLRALADEISPGTPWPDLVDELRRHHPEAGGLLDAYRDDMQRARQFTVDHDLATLAPGEVLEVVETPPFLRAIIPYAAYDPPPAFGDDMRGLFYVTPVTAEAPPEVRQEQLEGHCYYTLPVVSLHEGYPGHHLQLARAKLVDSPMRRQAQSSLFAEGWALYCEEMMHEVGFYADRRVRLFQLKDTLWRAARVMVDVALHTRGMTTAEAVDLMVDQVKLERPHAEAEVRRYTQTPTQPMSYLMGKHLILDLRRQYQARQGDAFRLREFHDQLLSYGTIPPPLVIQQVLG